MNLQCQLFLKGRAWDLLAKGHASRTELGLDLDAWGPVMTLSHGALESKWGMEGRAEMSHSTRAMVWLRFWLVSRSCCMWQLGSAWSSWMSGLHCDFMSYFSKAMHEPWPLILQLGTRMVINCASFREQDGCQFSAASSHLAVGL